jgi:hypothetical protein
MSDKGSGESEKQRRDRELLELLNELRVALPGIQVLFAFLLTIPFTGAFTQTTDPQRAMFFTAFLAATASSVLLIAPSNLHRILFREGNKELLLRTSNRLTIIGMGFLAVAMTATVFLITDVLFGGILGAIVAAAVGLSFAILWFVMPMSWREDTGK